MAILLKDMKSFLTLLCLSYAGLLLLVPLRVSAASYDVSASVAFPAPTQPAVFDNSLANAVSENEVFEVFGTCEYNPPTTIVVIMREVTILGSVNCESNGTFRLDVTLVRGNNNLIARSSSISGNYGPDSSPLSVSYAPKPAEPGAPEASVDSDLTITSPEAFTSLDDENTGTIQITVGGGKGPYTIAINWGDGTTETLMVPDAGTFSFRHTFLSKGIFKVVATVTDVLGVSKVYQFIVSSMSLPSDATEVETSQPAVIQKNEGMKWYVIAGGAALLATTLVIIGLSSFWLGRRYQYRKLKDRLINDVNEADVPLTSRKTKP